MTLYIVSNTYHKISYITYDPPDAQNFRNDSFSQWIYNFSFSLIYFTDTMFSFILLRRVKYLISICLQAYVFFILQENLTVKLSQYFFIDLLIESTTLSPLIKFYNLKACEESHIGTYFASIIDIVNKIIFYIHP